PSLRTTNTSSGAPSACATSKATGTPPRGSASTSRSGSPASRSSFSARNRPASRRSRKRLRSMHRGYPPPRRRNGPLVCPRGGGEAAWHRAWKEASVKAKELEPAVWALVFDKGDEPVSELERFAREHRLTAASFTAIGAFADAVLGYFDRERKDYEEIPVGE